jgi:hypothetical protein
MIRRRALHYELIDNRTGRVITAFTNLPEAIERCCHYMQTYPEDEGYVRLVIFEQDRARAATRILLNVGNDDLKTICEDAKVKDDNEIS